MIKELIDEIKKEMNIDVTGNIVKMKNVIILKNDVNFDFGRIFVVDLGKSRLSRNNFCPIGTSEDNNIHIKEKYYDILKGWYVVYLENDDSFILQPWQ